MPTTTYVALPAAIRGIGARTDAAGAAVLDISAEEDRLINNLLTEGALSGTAFLPQWTSGMNFTIGSGAAKVDTYAVAGEVAGQGVYLLRLEAASVEFTAPAADASQVRIDQVYIVVADAPYDAGSLSLARFGYRKGDPGGAAPGPDAAWKASALVTTVTVPAAASALSAGAVVDSRGFAAVIGTVPVGNIEITARSAAPGGYLLCDGAAVSRSTYSALFAAIGTQYGAGNGSTTFNVPNLKGRVPAGVDLGQTEFDTLGETGGAKSVTLTEAQLPSHTHGPARSSPASYTPGQAALQSTGSAGGYDTTAPSGSPGTTDYFIEPVGGGQAHPNLPPYLVLNFIIKV